MLWIGVSEAVSVGAIGGFVGGCLVGIIQKYSNKRIADHLQECREDELWQLRRSCELAHERITNVIQNLSTISVTKPVNNQHKYAKNNRL